MNTPNFDCEEAQLYAEQLKIINDVYAGIDTAREYIAKYVREEDTEYSQRQSLATITNYTKKAVEGIRDIIFRKPIDLSEVESTPLNEFLESIDYTNNITEFCKELTVTIAKDGYAYILVEKGNYDDNILTKADERNTRPFLVLLPRCRVRNWKVTHDGKYSMLTFDEAYIKQEGLFGDEMATRQRVYYADGRVEVWQDDVKVNEYQNGLGYMPIIKVDKNKTPPFYDLAKININHMNLKSEQRNYARIAAAPIAQLFMPENDTKVYTVGAGTGFKFSASKSEAGFEWAEISGQSNDMLNSLIEKDEADMRSYLTQLITSDVQRTAKEVSIENAGNESRVAHYANVIEDSINQALMIMADYQGIINYDPKIYINRDYVNKQLTEGQVREYKAMFAEGVISWEVLMQMLIDGEVLPQMNDKELETEKARLNG